MIYIELADAKQCNGMQREIEKALEYLATQDLQKLSLGRNEVEGDDIFINRMSYETMEESESFYEAHVEYIDIHYVLNGCENILVSDVRTMTEVKRELETDFIEYKGQSEVICKMKPGKVLIVFPNDAHMVKVKEQEVTRVEKIVVKVKIK